MDDAEGTLFIACVGGYVVTRAARGTLGELCAVADEGTLMGDGAYPESARLRWTREGREYRLHLRLLSMRRSGLIEPLDEYMIAYPEVASEVEFLKRAHAIVFIANDRSNRVALNKQALTVLRSDLAAAGRAPEDIPLVFQ